MNPESSVKFKSALFSQILKLKWMIPNFKNKGFLKAPQTKHSLAFQLVAPVDQALVIITQRR